MRMLHIGDLHIGKRVNEFNMARDQRHILSQIAEAAIARKVDVVLVAGDVYDKPVPTTESLELFEGFLATLSDAGIKTIVIPGNHDSAERMAFGSTFMESAGVHIAKAFGEAPQVVRLADAAGPVDFFMLPYIKPVYVRAAFPDEQIATYDDAVRVAVEHMPLEEGIRSVLVAHQFVTNAGAMPKVIEGTGIPPVAVGGVDNVDASLFDGFCYVALGHIHVPQSVRRPEVRYCGTPLKYTFNEDDHEKTLTLVELDASGNATIEELPLIPLHRMRTVTGYFDELREAVLGSSEESAAHDDGGNCENVGKDATHDDDGDGGNNTATLPPAMCAPSQDYVQVILKDDYLMDALAKVREFYPNVMALQFERTLARSRPAAQAKLTAADIAQKSLQELFEDYYEEQSENELDDAQTTLVQGIATELGGDAR